jgi:hypothetical protein
LRIIETACRMGFNSAKMSGQIYSTLFIKIIIHAPFYFP